MSKAPERIWAVHWNTEGAVMNGAWADTIRHFGGGVEYVRADVSRTAVEAAYIAGLDEAKSQGETVEYQDRPEWANTGSWVHAVELFKIRVAALKDPAHVKAAVAKLTDVGQ